MAIIHGKQTTDQVTPIAVNSAGAVLVELSSPTVILPVPATTLFSNLSLPAGSSTQTAYTVPSSQVHRLTGVTLVYVGTVATVTLRARVNNGTDAFAFYYVSPPVSNVPNTILVDILLGAGWTIECLIGNATLNDDIYVGVMVERVQ